MIANISDGASLWTWVSMAPHSPKKMLKRSKG